MQKTTIGWCTHTANPIIALDRTTGKRGWACTKVSPGCASCYSEVLNDRWGTKADYTPDGNSTVKWGLHEPELQKIRHAKGGTKVFLVDMSDLFHEQVPDAWLDQIFAAVWNAHHTDFQTLTKRAERQHAYWTDPARAQLIAVAAYRQWNTWDPHDAGLLRRADFEEAVTLPLKNLWHGVSVENQRMANERIPWLLKTPAAIRFLSVEPLLGSVNLASVDFGGGYFVNVLRQGRPFGESENIDQVIIGGESGPNPRQMKLAWLESLVDQCQAAGVSTFVKQDCALRPGQQGRISDAHWALKEFPTGAELVQ